MTRQAPSPPSSPDNDEIRSIAMPRGLSDDSEYLAAADGMPQEEHELRLRESFTDDEGGAHKGNLFNALRSRGGRSADATAPFSPLQFPLFQISGGGLQTRCEATLNLLNNLMGSALLAMPRGFANVGLLSGLALMPLMALANRYTLLQVLRMSQSSEEASYAEIGKRVFGRQGLLAVLTSYLLLCSGCLVAGLIACSDILRQVLDVHADTPRYVFVALAVVICAPGALLRSLKNVAFLSAICMIGIITITLVLSVTCISDVLSAADAEGVAVNSSEASWRLVRSDPRGLLMTASMFALQFSVQAGGIEVLTRVAPSAQRQDALDEEDSDGGYEPTGIADAEGISRISFAISVLLSCTCGCTGYLRFGDGVEGNILWSFDKDSQGHDFALTLARVAYMFVIVTSFAFMMVPCRCAAFDVCGVRHRSIGDSDNLSKTTFNRVTVLILLCCSAVACVVTDLAMMLDYVGVYATMFLAFLLPCSFLVELRRRHEGLPIFSGKNLLPLILIAFALAILIGSTAVWTADFLADSAAEVAGAAAAAAGEPPPGTTAMLEYGATGVEDTTATMVLRGMPAQLTTAAIEYTTAAVSLLPADFAESSTTLVEGVPGTQ